MFFCHARSGRRPAGEGVKEFPWRFASAHPPRAVASRQRSRNSGGRPRLAAEIPDIFRHGWRRAGKFRNDDGLGVVAVCSEGGRRGMTGRGASTHCAKALDWQYEGF